MALCMTIRGHGRRHNLEMTGSTIAVGIVVIGLLWSGAISASGLHTWHDLFSMICGPACLVMIIEMLISFGNVQRTSAPATPRSLIRRWLAGHSDPPVTRLLALLQRLSARAARLDVPA